MTTDIIPEVATRLLQAETIQQQNIGQLVNMLVMLNAKIEAMEKQMAQRATIDSRQARQMSAAVQQRAKELCEANGLSYDRGGAMMRDRIWHDVLHEFHVENRHDLPEAYFAQAMEFIAEWTSFTAVVRIRQKLG